MHAQPLLGKPGKAQPRSTSMLTANCVRRGWLRNRSGGSAPSRLPTIKYLHANSQGEGRVVVCFPVSIYAQGSRATARVPTADQHALTAATNCQLWPRWARWHAPSLQ